MAEEFNKQDGVSLEKYFDKRIDDMDKRLCLKIMSLSEKVDIIFGMSQTAINKAEESTNARLAIMNEFRNAMKDQASSYVSRDEFRLSSKMGEESLRKLELSRASLDGKADQVVVTRTTIMALISIFFGLAGFIFGLINILR